MMPRARPKPQQKKGKHTRIVKSKGKPLLQLPKVGYRYPLPRRWLLRYVLLADSMTNYRWWYWINTLRTGVVRAPIPQINFSSQGHRDTIKMFKKNIDFMHARTGHRMMEVFQRYFVPWLLWGLGAPGAKRPKINKETSEFWYNNFDLEPIMRHPHDYMPELLVEFGYKVPGWIPTPHSIAKLMSAITYPDVKTQTVESIQKAYHEPASGTGVITLEASNHSINMSVVDVSHFMNQLLTLNAYFYVPWLVFPTSRKRIFTQNILRYPILGKTSD